MEEQKDASEDKSNKKEGNIIIENPKEKTNLNNIKINKNSFTFKVEEGFEPEKSELFTINYTQEVLKKNKDLLAAEFDDDGQGFHSFNTKTDLFEGYLTAWNKNFPMIISPDIIWLLILQSFSTHMELNAEKLRKKFVNFAGKKTLTVRTSHIHEKNSSEWCSIIEKMIKDMEKYLGKQMLDLLDPCFSTATKISSICNKISMMGAMKKYFKYEFDGAGCSVSQMTVEGTVEDWKKIKERLKSLSALDKKLKDYSNRILPILDKIIDTIETKNIDIEFWKGFIKKKEP